MLASLLALFLGQAAPPAGQGAELRFLLTFGGKGDQPGEFHSPVGIAIGAGDQVLVTDLNNARLQRFTSGGRHLGGFDLPPDAPGRDTNLAGGIALGEKGEIYLSFMGQDKVAVYTEAGALLREWGKRGAGDGEFHMPGGMVLSPQGELYVADQCNHRIQKFTREGKFLAKWGEHGSGPGQFGGGEPAGSRFGGPHFLALDRKGRLYTTEGAPGRVQQFSADGKPLLSWGDQGDGPGGFGALKTGYAKNTFGPVGIVVDAGERVWVSSLNDRVQAFTPEGKFLFGIGSTGQSPGQFSRPHGMAFDRQGHLYVADASNQRIQKFELPPP